MSASLLLWDLMLEPKWFIPEEARAHSQQLFLLGEPCHTDKPDN